jgi:CheY-like chemotaxis protein
MFQQTDRVGSFERDDQDVDQIVKTDARILVVDDDTALVHLLRESLEAEGYRVCVGYDGQMAIQLAHKEKPDLIVLDVSMPMLNGIKVFQFLRESADTRPIPVIFLSGELSKDIYPVIESSQRVAHVKKPMDLESLQSLIRQFLQNYPVVPLDSV